MNWTEQQLQDYYAGRGRRVPLVPTPPKKGRARGSHKAGVMNKLEHEYSRYLDLSKKSWLFEAVTLRLGPDCRFTPDFFVVDYATYPPTELQFHEVKSTRRGKMFSEDDSKVKIRVAVNLFPCFRFFVCHKLPNGEWEQKEIR